MPTVTPVTFESFNADLPNGVHNLGADTLKVYLTNTAPNHATMSDKVDLAEIAAGGGYTAGGLAVTVTSSSQTAGTYSLVGDVASITAAGGSIGPFRYAIMYNDTTVGDKLIFSADYGSSITVADGEQFDVIEGANIMTFSI